MRIKDLLLRDSVRRAETDTVWKIQLHSIPASATYISTSRQFRKKTHK